MKKILTSLLLLSFYSTVNAQILCIFCYDQNDSISQNVNNLILNGGFENTTCALNSNGNTFCPNSMNYNCDIMDWLCTGGGQYTYSCFYDSNFWYVQSGTHSVYFGNSFCPPCNTGDTSCLVTNDCETTGISPGYPLNGPDYGNANGISIEQNVSGLTPGATYVLEFWAGGEDMGNFPNQGLFGLDVGFGYTYLRNNATQAHVGIGKRYVVVFNADSVSHTIKFTNWGHICNECTELVLDDVRLYTLAELSPVVPVCAGANVSVMFNAPNHICPGTCTQFTNLSLNATTFLWSFPGATPSVSTDPSPTNICYNTPGAYPVTLIGSNGITGDTLTLNNYITVYPFPPPQGILQNGDTLFANAGGVTYQWFFNGAVIPGATDQYYVATASGNYNVVATDENSCEVEAVLNNVIAVSSQLAVGNLQLAIFPNPVKNKLEVRNLEQYPDASIKIYSILGTAVSLPTVPKFRDKLPTCLLDVSMLPPGIYFLELKTDSGSIVKRFVKSTSR